MEEAKKTEVKDSDIQIIELEKESAYNFKRRRVGDWDNIYQLYRDRVVTNRITQRQSVNVPLMKYGIATIMKDIDEPPQLYFTNLDNDQQKEVYYNEHWKEVTRRQKLVIRDIIDKKNGCLFGRTFKKLNIENGRVTFEIVDPKDMLVHRYVDPADMDTAPCVIQIGIYKSLTDITENEDWDKGTRAKLKKYFSEQGSSLEAQDNFETASKKAIRMADLGVPDAFTPVLGETYVELNEVYRYEYDKDLDRKVIMFYITAVTDGGTEKLYKKPLHEHMGKATADNFWYDHFNYSSWGTDPERADFWSDGIGDILRTPNNIANSWISQLVENRTLRNFGMTFYDSSDPAFVPQIFQPIPFGFYPTPGNPNELMMPVDIPSLDDSLEDIQFIIGLAEKATAATSTQTGAVEQKSVTLGEVELALANAQDRVKSIQVFIDDSWKDFGLKYIKMLEAAGDMLDPVTINKKGRLGLKMYTREITQKSYNSRSGYTCEVQMQADKQAEDADKLQKLNAALVAMPDNVPLRAIYNKHIADFAGLTPEEKSQVEEFEKQKLLVAPQQQAMGMPVEGQPMEEQGLPEVPDIVGAPVGAQVTA